MSMSPYRPCGTEAALRRHQRRGEPACASCLQAGRRAAAERAGQFAGAQSLDGRPFRNGIPETPGYAWRTRTYPWAVRVLRAAEVVHGIPQPDLALTGKAS